MGVQSQVVLEIFLTLEMCPVPLSCCCWVVSVVSDSARPDRRQPTRLPHPWDSLGKKTGVGCHFLLQCMKVKSKSEVAQSCLTQRPHGLQPTRLLCPWDFPGKSTGVGCHCLLRMTTLIGIKYNSCFLSFYFRPLVVSDLKVQTVL